MGQRPKNLTSTEVEVIENNSPPETSVSVTAPMLRSSSQNIPGPYWPAFQGLWMAPLLGMPEPSRMPGPSAGIAAYQPYGYPWPVMQQLATNSSAQQSVAMVMGDRVGQPTTQPTPIMQTFQSGESTTVHMLQPLPPPLPTPISTISDDLAVSVPQSLKETNWRGEFVELYEKIKKDRRPAPVGLKIEDAIVTLSQSQLADRILYVQFSI